MRLPLLPDDVLLMILGNLGTETDIFSLLQVNHRLYEIAMPYLYQHNIKHSGSSALHWYAKAGRELGVQRLLSFHADVNATSKSDSGFTALRLAVERDHAGVVKLLLENGADAQRNNFLVIHRAVSNGNKAVVKMLLDHGGDVNSVDQFGGSLLKDAAKYGDLEMVQLLLDYGADVNKSWVNPGEAHSPGVTPLHTASDSRNQNVGLLSLLLDHGADPNAIDNGRQTPLHWAAAGTVEEKLKVLLDRGAPVNAQNAAGQTALDIASARGRDANVLLLREYGANSIPVPGQCQFPEEEEMGYIRPKKPR
ncbi:uncharacterized protein N7459_001686 [Penicillium hispanicum]|uniref:uncharacterized protein n=1 Tax=Penicillium hispanicum TaxID=1080232 RepID=UPI00253FCD47|nr:uncharacterized protein N7459_001686 [Penicillium hispanicum]KAJ5595478.1 hypothetical protein N7459_001686 [Penicillium hispanicum]